MKAGCEIDLCGGPGVPQLAQQCMVVVAYDDLSAGKQAMELVSWLSFEHGDLRFEARPWRFDFLKHPSYQESAVADGVKADVLILSVSNPFDLPESVRAWLTQSLAYKQGSTAAIVALFGAKGYHDIEDSPRLKFVQSAATAAGADFFAPFSTRPGPARAGSFDNWEPPSNAPAFAPGYSRTHAT
jgi:hypothetical protein